MLFVGIGPGPPVKCVECDASPLQLETAVFVAVNPDMHHHGTGLLDLTNATELDPVTEPGSQLAARGIGAEITGRDARQDKENGGRS